MPPLSVPLLVQEEHRKLMAELIVTEDGSRDGRGKNKKTAESKKKPEAAAAAPQPKPVVVSADAGASRNTPRCGVRRVIQCCQFRRQLCACLAHCPRGGYGSDFFDGSGSASPAAGAPASAPVRASSPGARRREHSLQDAELRRAAAATPPAETSAALAAAGASVSAAVRAALLPGSRHMLRRGRLPSRPGYSTLPEVVHTT